MNKIIILKNGSILDTEEKKALGLVLSKVESSIDKNKDYKIEKNILEVVEKLSPESRNIFFHDVAMDYINAGSLSYVDYLKEIIDLKDISYASAQHILGKYFLEKGDVDHAFECFELVNQSDKNIYL